METEEERRKRRRRRLLEMKRMKRRTEFVYRRLIPAAGLAAMLVCLFWVGSAIGGQNDKDRNRQQDITQDDRTPEGKSTGQGIGNLDDTEYAEPVNGPGTVQALLDRVTARPAVTPQPTPQPTPIPTPQPVIYEAYSTNATQEFGTEIDSKYGIFIDLEEGAILAQKDAWARMNPASMTKILTVLVAAEHLDEAQLEDKVPITRDITDYCYINECSVAGFALDEQVLVRDLFYGTILPSGADAAVALAAYVAGSHEAFVDLMNEKLDELGLSDSSHFTNCVGLYDKNHYTTVYDMAMILQAAADNEFCRQVLITPTYRTAQTEQHPEGRQINNKFLRTIAENDTHGKILCGKTGFVNESRNCAASLGIDGNGREYICVTGGASSAKQCIADQTALYQQWLPESQPTPQPQ